MAVEVKVSFDGELLLRVKSSQLDNVDL